MRSHETLNAKSDMLIKTPMMRKDNKGVSNINMNDNSVLSIAAKVVFFSSILSVICHSTLDASQTYTHTHLNVLHHDRSVSSLMC